MFDFNLPELSDSTWATICDNDEERERLEFVGDALMSAAVAEELYRTFTNGSPGLYTVQDSSYACILFSSTSGNPKCTDCERDVRPPHAEAWLS